jgi:hypothetical protein
VPLSLEDLADLNLPQAIRLHSPWLAQARLHEADGVLLHQGAAAVSMLALALARGARAVTQHASHMGEAIYRQLG